MRSAINFLVDEDGVTSVEYAVILALLLMAMLVAIQLLGTKTSGLWGRIADSVPQGSS